MRDLVVGQQVFGANGQPVTILAATEEMEGRPCYRVTFRDGNSIIADANHEWEVIHSYGPNRVKKIVTTKTMADTGVGPTGKKGYTKYRWHVKLPKVLNYCNGSEPQSLDPYCLGTWLGDGTACRADITTADPEIVTAWENAGFKMVPKKAYLFRIRESDGSPAQFIHILGVRNNKHIPGHYLHGSYETRLALLQGLMDTDGSVESGTPMFWNTNKALAEQVYELAVGLGARVKWHEKKATLYGKDCGICYYISIRATFAPFRLPRKACLVTSDKQAFWPIVSIEPVESVPVRCIMVDAPDHLYLIGKNCLPTHNSYMAIQIANAISKGEDWLGFSIMKPGKVLYLQLDTPRSVWAHRFQNLVDRGAIDINNKMFLLADRECLAHYPFDILQPGHTAYLKSIIEPHHPRAVIIDTLRESHSGDEDSSTTARNVIANLTAAVSPAALILISHSRKPHPDSDRDLMADHRGSSYITGRMDAIMRLTHKRLFYSGRSIESGDIKLQRQDNGLWLPEVDEAGPIIEKVLADPLLPTLRAKARAIAPLIGTSEEAAMSRLRRLQGSKPLMTQRLTDEVVEIAEEIG